MARFYSNENIPIQVVMEPQRLGHDVVTSLDADKANSAVPDSEVLSFAAGENRILLTTIAAIFYAFVNTGLQTTPVWS